MRGSTTGFDDASNHVLEACPFRDLDRRVEVLTAAVLVRHVFDEQDVVLVLAGIHASPQFVAGRP